MEYKQPYSPNSTTHKSPINSLSPSQSTTELCYDKVDDVKCNSEMERVIKFLQYEHGSKIADTLQGTIWRLFKTTDHSVANSSVLKVVDRFLQKHSLAHVNGETYKVSENILMEKKILKYLTEQEDCPDSITKYLRFFKTKSNFFLLQQDGGQSLYDFIVKAHRFIELGNIDINHWKTVCKIIFRQMVECISYIHKKRVCHMDISLENFLINDVDTEIIADSKNKNKYKMQFIISNIKIKLCDFGVAKHFSNDNFRSNHFVGKEGYKSPEVIGRKSGFNAKANDVFCLGVCLFSLCTGTSPWEKADKNDKLWQYVVHYGVKNLVVHWNSLHLVDEGLLNILESMLTFEEHRITLRKIKKIIAHKQKICTL
eukprot:298617_1